MSVGIFFLGFAVGVLFCELCEYVVRKTNERLEKVEAQLKIEEDIKELKKELEKEK